MSDAGPARDERPGAQRDERRGERCFGCSAESPSGLRLEVDHGGDGTATAILRPRPEHEGPPGHLHGGLVATALDEIMGWAAHETADDGWVTATIEVRYRRPVPLGEGPYRIEAETTRASGRRKRLIARLLLGDGSVAAEARGTFVRVRRGAPGVSS